MFCQKCRCEMIQAEKYGVAIESCATCGGVWLTEGELSELVTRATRLGPSANEELPPARRFRLDYGRPWADKRHRRHPEKDDDDYDYKRGKKSIWDIFD